ncbi:MAG: hypothetical protein IT367_12840 [Candidatus Hydrogenedentes bacterium]|nr:hypothetical protein [Candidatus Hydrogenedentota bacterium]
MPSEMTAHSIEEILHSFPWIDPHTHIDAAHLSARGLDDILLYHMCVSDLYAAGCPSGARVPENRSEEEAARRVEEAIPYLAKARNTAMAWGVRIILADLYNWHTPIDASNWRNLDRLIKHHASNPSWPREILKRANIARTGTELYRGRDGSADDLLEYAIEWAFFARTQWGQPDIPLYELERAWNATTPQQPIPVTFDRKAAASLHRTITSVDDIDAAVAHYCALLPYGKVKATAQHISTDIDYSLPDRDAVNTALKARGNAGNRERDIYSSYILHRFLGELEKHGDEIVFQFSLGAESLPFESGSRLSQRTIGQLAEIVARYPRLKFMCFLSSRHGNQSLCTLARELPNFSLCGYWWHNFFPGAIRQVMEERLDMLPMNKQIGFFSDAYCVEWTYAKAVMVRKLLAEVFANKVQLGQYTFNDIHDIAYGILHQSSKELLGMTPKE